MRDIRFTINNELLTTESNSFEKKLIDMLQANGVSLTSFEKEDKQVYMMCDVMTLEDNSLKSIEPSEAFPKFFCLDQNKMYFVVSGNWVELFTYDEAKSLITDIKVNNFERYIPAPNEHSEDLIIDKTTSYFKIQAFYVKEAITPYESTTISLIGFCSSSSKNSVKAKLVEALSDLIKDQTSTVFFTEDDRKLITNTGGSLYTSIQTGLDNAQNSVQGTLILAGYADSVKSFLNKVTASQLRASKENTRQEEIRQI